MAKSIDEIPLINFKLNYDSEIPLYKQLYEVLRKAILDGKIQPGKRLPGTRSLASELKISRNTASIAFDQLKIEGYINGRSGSGSFVNEVPDNSFMVKEKSHHKGKLKESQTIKLNDGKRSKTKRKNVRGNKIIPFQNGIPAINEFPIRSWSKIITQVSSSFSNSNLGYGDAAGYKPLREVISSYLRTYRGVNCAAEQVIIVNGSQQGLDLIGRVLLKKRSNVWIEDPGYSGVRASIALTESVIHYCPLDEKGLDIKYSSKHNPKPDLIYTTPSHQFPLGITMSADRRMELLEYARRNNCWIIEDDYDSEFRYVGNPLPSLQGLDQNKSVLYLGTFSKVLFPGLRLGYLVVPSNEIFEELIFMKYNMDRQSPILDQIILSKYIEDDHFTKHIRKMRMLYKTRQELLVEEINKHLNGLLEVRPTISGMQIIGWLPKEINDKMFTEEAIRNDVIVHPLSDYSIKYHKDPAVILGYTAFNEEEIKEGVQKLKEVFKKF